MRKRWLIGLMALSLALAAPATAFSAENGAGAILAEEEPDEQTGEVWDGETDLLLSESQPRTEQLENEQGTAEEERESQAETESFSAQEEPLPVGTEAEEEETEESLLLSIEEVSEVPKAVAADETNSTVSGGCGEHLTWTLGTDGTLTISGSGGMYDYATQNDYDVDEDGYDAWVNARAPWYGSRASITSLVVESGVTSIGRAAFYFCSNLTDVEIADTVTALGDSAFESCESLVSLELPEGLTSIGEDAFAYCYSLSAIELPDSLRSVGDGAFTYCESLTAVEIPEGVTELCAFYMCTGLKSITLPESLTSIIGGAFYGCASLTELTIPAQVSSIGTQAFAGCSSLVKLTVSEDNKTYSFSDGVLYSKDGKTLVLCLVSRSGELKIPSGVTTIAKRAFSGCTGLTSVTLPKGVKKISSCAFEYCTGLTSVSLPNSLKTIGSYAFFDCSALTGITIPDKVTYLRERTFSGCTSLTEVTLPSKLTKMGASVFANCESLTGITIPDGVTSLGYGLFSNSGLTSVHIPEGVTSIAGGMFEGCSDLVSIFIPSSVTSIGESAFRDCTSLSDVYYAGKKKAFRAISIDSWNESLTSAVIHYNALSMDAEVPSCRVTALKNTSNGVKISWSAAEVVDGYYIYRKTESGSYKRIKTIKNSTTQSYTDKAVKDENGTTYYYKVCAYLDGTKGSGIAGQIVRLNGTTITGLTVSSDGVLTIEWEKAEAISGYKIDIHFADGSTAPRLVSAKKTSYTYESVSAEEILYVRIQTYVNVLVQTEPYELWEKYRSAWTTATTVTVIE
ncbi:MAG: leucine-rich repeat protein [Lachnospiraceae bacterium]|nr:leucine-rich repeat protein [Lachnospiraceae bacterium]